MTDGFKIYDTHTHIGVARHSGRRYTAEQLLRDMDGYGVDRSMLIPWPVVEDARAAHDEIGRAMRAWPERFAGAACLYPYIPEQEFRDEVRRCREEYGFTAIKLQPQYQPLNPLWATSDFFFETAIENDFTIICHTGTGIPYALPSLMMEPARRWPELRIVLAHCGGGGIFAAEAIIAASFCPNIYLELSTLMPNHVHEVLHRVPSSRLMIGSDLPENLAVEMGKILGLGVGEQVRAEILWGTAREVLG
jgi:uncharacterized protein